MIYWLSTDFSMLFQAFNQLLLRTSSTSPVANRHVEIVQMILRLVIQIDVTAVESICLLNSRFRICHSFWKIITLQTLYNDPTLISLLNLSFMISTIFLISHQISVLWWNNSSAPSWGGTWNFIYDTFFCLIELFTCGTGSLWWTIR